MIHFVPFCHALWVSFLQFINKGIGKKGGLRQEVQRAKEREQTMFWSKVFMQEIKMVGERSRKESVGEAEKWRKRTKVWERLEKGRIAHYIDKLHGYDQEVTKIMVNSWKDRRVRIDGVMH